LANWRVGERSVSALAEAMSGGAAFGWASYALLWSGLAGGATAGACAFAALSLNAIWIAAVAMLVTALVVARARANVI
jgi:uncharacterized membrane protein YoaK (UPF0700 family)